MAQKKTRQPVALLPEIFEVQVDGGKLLLTSGQELNDAGWGARFGLIQDALQTRLWNEDTAFNSCHIDLSTCKWADPLPLMSLAIALSEFELSGGKVSLQFGSIETAEVPHKQLLKYMAREGFLSLFACPNIVPLPSGGNVIGQNLTEREVRIGNDPLTDELMEKLKSINIPLAFERSTCLPATLLHFDCIKKSEGDASLLDDIDRWVERKLYEAIEPVVSDMVPGWAQRGVRYRLLMTLRELLHNVAEHAYEVTGLAAVYVRYREGALGESPATWARHEKFIRREYDSRVVPLMEPASDRESFPKTRAGFFEVFVLDSGKGLCNSLGEPFGAEIGSPLQKCMLEIFDKSRGRRPERPTQYGGIFLLSKLLEPMRDYLRIRDEDSWWGTELPLKRTEAGSTPTGKITQAAQGLEHVKKAVEGVAWTARLSWLDHTDLVMQDGQWHGLIDEKTDKGRRNELLQLLDSDRDISPKSVVVVDCRFQTQTWRSDREFSDAAVNTVMFFPRAGWMKNHIQNEIAKVIQSVNMASNGSFVIGDIPSEEAVIYLAAVEKSNKFVGEPFSRIHRLVLVTRDLKACVLARDSKRHLVSNTQMSSDFVRSGENVLSPDEDLIVYFSALRYHDALRLWEITQKAGGAYLDEKVKWNEKTELDGYLDFPQSLAHPMCREIYSLTLQRLTGLFPRHECELSALDGLVDSVVVRFNAAQHPRPTPKGLKRDRVHISIGSVQVSGLTEHFGKEKNSHVFYFFRHPSGSLSRKSSSRHLLPWLASATGKVLDAISPFSRVGRTPVVARDGWKAYRMPRYDSKSNSIYEQAPKESYLAWQEPSRTPLKLGHWSYGGHHDLLTLNLLMAFDTELDRINLAFGGSLARFVYANFFNIFGLNESHLNDKGREIFQAIRKDKYQKLLPADLEGALLLYPSHPVTDHMVDRFLSLVSDIPADGTEDSPLDDVRNHLIAVLPIRRHRGGSGLQISGLILERLKQIGVPKPPVVWFDDALISGRTYADTKRMLRSMGFKNIYSLTLVDRQRYQSADHAEAPHHSCYWRLDVPVMGGNNCPLCQALTRVRDLAADLNNSKYIDRVKSWRDSWEALNPATQWGDGGLRPIPLWLNKPERKFSIEPDPDVPGAYRQVGGKQRHIRITNTAGLIAYVTEMHSITSHDDLSLRIIKKEQLPYEARIQLLSSQLLLFSNEFDRDLKRDLGLQLMEALWDAEIHDRHTALAVLCLVGCGDEFFSDVVSEFFSGEVGKLRRMDAVTRSIDATILLALVLLMDRAVAAKNPRLTWLINLDEVRGLLKPNGKLEVYGWLHGVVSDRAGKSHTPPLHRLIQSGSDPEMMTSSFIKTTLLSVLRLQTISKSVRPYWLRNDCEAYDKYEEIQKNITNVCSKLKDGLESLLEAPDAKVLRKAKQLAEVAIMEAEKLHVGVFCAIGIESMRSEGANIEPAFMQKLRNIPTNSNEGMLLLWHSPSPNENAMQLQALNKPEMAEAFVLWDAGLVEAILGISTNIKYAKILMGNPWVKGNSNNSSAHLWGRFVLEEKCVCIELCNSAIDPVKSAHDLNEKLSPSRAFLENSGSGLNCAPYKKSMVMTTIRIPYAHTLRLKETEVSNA